MKNYNLFIFFYNFSGFFFRNYILIEEFDLPDDAPPILKDERIEVTYTVDKVVFKQQMRRVVVYSKKYKKAFVYITNNFELTAIEIAAIYTNRWQIETFFKKLKQNFPLTCFLG